MATTMKTHNPGMNARAALLTTIVVAGIRTAIADSILVQAPNCLQEFSWMSNSQGQSPCDVAGFLLAPCHGNIWTVQAITNASQHYTPPDATTQNTCQCSWAVYNLMQACADCQGTDFQSDMLTWVSWSQGCDPSSLTNDTFYPLNVGFSNTTSIPSWATTDPTTWHDGIFDPSTAQNMSLQGTPGITNSSRFGTSSSSSSDGGSSDVAAIAGGVVGGIVGVALLGLLGFILYRRHQRKYRRNGRMRNGTRVSLQAHSRSNSDYTTRKVNMYDPSASVSPGPSLPLTMESTGAGFSSVVSGYGYGVGVGAGMNNVNGRPPIHHASSFSSFPTLSVGTPPPHTDPTKPFATALATGNMFVLNGSNPTISSSFPPPAMPAPAAANMPSTGQGYGHGHSHGHSHTLSNQSAMTQSSSGAGGQEMVDTREGAISPYVLPPLAPEPMDPELEDPKPSPSQGGHVHAPGHMKGASSGSADSNYSNYYSITGGPSPTGAAPVAVNTATAGGVYRVERERLNPPAYSPTPEDMERRHEFGAAQDGLGDNSDLASVDVQPADTATQALSGTTLAQASAAQSEIGAGMSQAGGGRYGYARDVKRPY